MKYVLVSGGVISGIGKGVIGEVHNTDTIELADGTAPRQPLPLACS